MNQNFSELEQKLERAGGKLSLSASEKDAGRERLRSYLAGMPEPARTKQAFAHGFRFAFTFLLIVAVGGGAASAAENALPGTILYPLKTQVTEPIRAAFTMGAEDRADFAVERASRRLEEYAQVSGTDAGDEETSAALALALKSHVEEATDAINELASSGEAVEALDATSDLHSILEAHASVLTQLEEENPDTANDSDTVNTALEEVLADTDALTDVLQDSIDASPEGQVEDSLETREEEVVDLLAVVRARVEKTLMTLDMSDQTEISGELTAVNTLLEKAQAAEKTGDFPKALAFYGEANEELNRLGVLLDADAAIDIDIEDADSGDASLP